MRRRGEGIVRRDGADVHAHIVGRDMAAVARAGEPRAVLGDAVQIVGIGELALGAVLLHPLLHVVGIAPALEAIEAVGAAPHLAQRGHGHARRAHGADALREVAHEQRQRARGAVRLDGQLVDQIGAGDAPVRQRAGMRVDIGQDHLVRAAVRLAGNRVHAADDRVLARDGHGDLLGAVARRLAQLLRPAGRGQPRGGEIRGKALRGQGKQQAGERRQQQTDDVSHDRYPPYGK